MPTIRRCCIVGCLSNSRQNPQLQFFQFPRAENPFHKLWKQACQASLSRILPFKKPVVCALHFRPNCIGGRRLTASAVPSLRLEVPQNLKAVEQQAMIEEIERSRKCAYINAVVYEWLVRANLNPQLRGSITHGMIKEKAETARQVIGSTSFVADNRWLNRFRETHLTGFAQKLASNQLKPVGSSLWIPDIVQDLQHMFPPTNADRVSFENVPEQYYDYMQQQYGEYEEDDDTDQKSNGSSYNDQTQYAQQQDLKSQPQQQQQQQSQQRSPNSFSGYESYGPMSYAGGYEDYHYPDRKPQQKQQQLPTKSPHGTPRVSPTPQQSHPSRPLSHSPHSQQTSPLPQESATARASKQHNESPRPAKSARYDEPDGEREENTIEDLTDGLDESQNDNGSDASRRSSSSDNDNDAANDTATNGNDNDNSNSNDGNDSPASSPPLTSLGQNGHTIRPVHLPKTTSQSKTNGNTTTNGHATPTPTNKTNGIDVDQQPNTPSSNTKRIELQNYAQALEYLKPLEDFVLLKENFRAIGIISHLESILRKARQHPNAPDVTDVTDDN